MKRLFQQIPVWAAVIIAALAFCPASAAGEEKGQYAVPTLELTKRSNLESDQRYERSPDVQQRLNKLKEAMEALEALEPGKQTLKYFNEDRGALKKAFRNICKGLNDVERISKCHSVTDSVADEVSGTSIVILSVKINTLTARINSGEIKESQNEAGLKSILGNDLSDTSIKRRVLLTKELARRSGHAGKLGIVAGLFVAFYEWFSEPEDYLDYDPRVLGPVEPKNPSSGVQRDIDVTVEAEPDLK